MKSAREFLSKRSITSGTPVLSALSVTNFGALGRSYRLCGLVHVVSRTLRAILQLS
jgi:hypothetical protein